MSTENETCFQEGEGVSFLNKFNNEISRAILDADRLEELLDQIGLDYFQRWERNVYRGPCVAHEGDGPNMTVYTNGDEVPISWKCWSRNCEQEFTSSLVGLVRGALTAERGHKCTVREAMSFLRRFVNARPATSENRKPVRLKTDINTRPCGIRLTREQVRATLDIPSRYYLERGYSAEILDRFDVGYSWKKNRVIVPLYDDCGEMCVGYLGRTIYPECDSCNCYHQPGRNCPRVGVLKWKLSDGFKKQRYLYNYFNVSRCRLDVLLVTEGPGDVWRAAEAGISAVALLGVGCTEQQAERIASLGCKVLVALDNDQAGNKAAPRVLRMLEEAGVMAQRVAIPGDFKDLGECPPHLLRNCLAPPGLARQDWG